MSARSGIGRHISNRHTKSRGRPLARLGKWNMPQKCKPPTTRQRQGLIRRGRLRPLRQPTPGRPILRKNTAGTPTSPTQDILRSQRRFPRLKVVYTLQATPSPPRLWHIASRGRTSCSSKQPRQAVRGSSSSSLSPPRHGQRSRGP